MQPEPIRRTAGQRHGIIEIEGVFVLRPVVEKIPRGRLGYIHAAAGRECRSGQSAIIGEDVPGERAIPRTVLDGPEVRAFEGLCAGDRKVFRLHPFGHFIRGVPIGAAIVIDHCGGGGRSRAESGDDRGCGRGDRNAREHRSFPIGSANTGLRHRRRLRRYNLWPAKRLVFTLRR